MTTPRAGRSHWSADHGGHHNGSETFQDLLVESIRATGGVDTGSYLILPNYVFDHTALVIAAPNDLPQGKLEIRRKHVADETRYTIQRHDTTSGENLKLCFARSQGGDDRAVAVRVDRSVPRSPSAEGGRYVRRTAIDCPRGALVSFELFDALPELASESRPFTLFDPVSGLQQRLRSFQVDRHLLKTPEGATELDVIALVGKGSIPTYWWRGEDGRLLLLATTLWTYVITND